ncbi:MAG: hypothetical protein ACI86H_003022 [bacterium]|jgi:hypothetical protein
MTISIRKVIDDSTNQRSDISPQQLPQWGTTRVFFID